MDRLAALIVALSGCLATPALAAEFTWGFDVPNASWYERTPSGQRWSFGTPYGANQGIQRALDWKPEGVPRGNYVGTAPGSGPGLSAYATKTLVPLGGGRNLPVVVKGPVPLTRLAPVALRVLKNPAVQIALPFILEWAQNAGLQKQLDGSLMQTVPVADDHFLTPGSEMSLLQGQYKPADECNAPWTPYSRLINRADCSGGKGVDIGWVSNRPANSCYPVSCRVHRGGIGKTLQLLDEPGNPLLHALRNLPRIRARPGVQPVQIQTGTPSSHRNNRNALADRDHSEIRAAQKPRGRGKYRRRRLIQTATRTRPSGRGRIAVDRLPGNPLYPRKPWKSLWKSLWEHKPLGA